LSADRVPAGPAHGRLGDDPVLNEKELRLALVCYGGVSLAVYMHGVTKEVLKLARASKAYHGIHEFDERQGSRFADTVSDTHEHDSEDVYFEILQSIGRKLDLRVVVDIIAGASAGGINGVILARALAHDLSIEGLRDVWLRQADVAELLAPERKASRWSKWFMKPLLWGYSWMGMRELRADAEMRGKLSMFLRSRWFRPPFSGRGLALTLLNGIGAMPPMAGPTSSLLPLGQRLELFVTVTDFYGYLRNIRIHDPPLVREREHRHVLRFAYCRWPNGDLATDFDDENVPALAFASRATSSFPGAFPPAQVVEMERVLLDNGREWRRRDEFLAGNFIHYRDAGADPELTSFLDGSVLNNKPLAEAIQAIRDRPAFRQVDRRIVYVDPDPMGPPPPASGQRPGFFRTLKGALSDIPRQEPIYDDLVWVAGFNQRVRRASAMVEATRERVLGLVTELAPDAFTGPLSPERVAAWRETAAAYAAREAGFVHAGYLGLRRLSVLGAMAELLARLAGHEPETDGGLLRAMQHWGRLPHEEDGAAGAHAAPETNELLRRYDADFRRRRVRFVIRALNLLYGRLGSTDLAGLTSRGLDQVKARLYAQLDVMRTADATALQRARQDSALMRLAAPAFADAWMQRDADPELLLAMHAADMDQAMAGLAKALDLAEIDLATDALISEISGVELPDTARQELLTAYIGFAFWDIITFPLANWRDLGEFDEIRVDRISPDDAVTIRAGGAKAVLKGIEFGHFGAFFSRAHRENDYLWGRLQGAERLIDLLYDAARLEDAEAELDARALKIRVFQTILAAERQHLAAAGDLIDELEREVAAL
jgi:patatin-related protein